MTEGQSDIQSEQKIYTLGRMNIGWTVGEEVLFDKLKQKRSEQCVAESEGCLLGILKSKLAIL